MTIVKDKSSIKYYILAGIILLCIYSSEISNLFIPIFDNIYYGNLVKLFVSATNLILWTLEFVVILLVCKSFKIKLLNTKEEKKKELPLWRLCLLFGLTVLPMLIISVYLNFKVKLVYSLGIRITSVNLACNAVEIVSNIMRMSLIVLFIRCLHLAFDTNFKFNKIIIPWGAILSFLCIGLIDFFVFPVDLNWFYLICSFYYGIIYLVADKKYLNSTILCYLIWLL